tara:strand:- start:1038 stop:1427 length:390 start_codon:yes stop_codon:yes gene_type:complete
MDTAIEHTISKNDVNSIFFSKENVAALQQGIRYTVFRESQQIIGNQNETELMVIMRSIYLQYAKNLPDNILSQIRDLNGRVLDYVVPKITIELNQYKTYIRDASGLPVPMDRGQNTSVTGTKFLRQGDF